MPLPRGPGRRPRSGRANGRVSLCLTRVAARDRHPRRRIAPRYGAIFTGATLVASILVALAVWPAGSMTLPGMEPPGSNARPAFVEPYTLDDVVARLH